jgi:hypothetical protein
MKPTFPAAIIAPIILNLGYTQANTFSSPTAVSVLVETTESQPTITFKAAQIDSAYLLALDWLDLSKTVLANTQPLTAEERSSINDFFWSHF